MAGEAASDEATAGYRIRMETAADHAAVAAVVAAAFRGPAEAELVAAIRASEHHIPELALVAELGDRVVGHVMISYVGLEATDGTAQRWRIPSLAPLAVDPERHGQGIGWALVRAVITAAGDRGEPMVVLEGSPQYYGRLGFEDARRHGIELPLPSWAPPDAGQVLRLPRYEPALRGRVVYPPAFGAVTSE